MKKTIGTTKSSRYVRKIEQYKRNKRLRGRTKGKSLGVGSRQYCITVGEHMYYAENEAELEGILTRIRAEGLKDKVHIESVSLADREVNRQKGASSGNATDTSVRELPARHTPPEYAEYVLFICLAREDRETLPGDLCEEFHEIILPKFGLRRARLWYSMQVLRSVGPLLFRRLTRLMTWGTVARAAQSLWRWFGA